MKSCLERKEKQNLSKSNSDEAVLSESMKRADDKAENVFKEHNSVSLTKSSDKDKRRLHEYYLHNKVRIRQRHKDYYNNNKKRIRGSTKNNRKKQKISLKNPQGRLEKFQLLAKRGPIFIFVVYNRCLYARRVMKFQFNKYNLDLAGIMNKVTKNGTTYICNTCHCYLKKFHIPSQAVCNKVQIFETPAEIKKLNRLERIFIARRILFKKVTIMPKGQFPKLKGAICNIPTETSDIANVLPCSVDSSGLIMVKPKLSVRGHVCFSPVSPESVYLALSYFKVKDPFYKDLL